MALTSAAKAKHSEVMQRQGKATCCRAEAKQRAVRHSNGNEKQSRAKRRRRAKEKQRMVCEECTRYRGMKDGMVRCWDSQLMILTCIPISSMRRNKECPKWAKKRSSKT